MVRRVLVPFWSALLPESHSQAAFFWRTERCCGARFFRPVRCLASSRAFAGWRTSLKYIGSAPRQVSVSSGRLGAERIERMVSCAERTRQISGGWMRNSWTRFSVCPAMSTIQRTEHEPQHASGFRNGRRRYQIKCTRGRSAYAPGLYQTMCLRRA